MSNLKLNDKIISIASINATLIGIFTAIFLAYVVNTYSKIEELEFDALKEAEKINQITSPTSMYIPPFNFNDFFSGKKYHNLFVYVNFLLSENPPKGLNEYPIPKDSAERARKALSIMTSIMRTFPFPDYSVKADRKAGYPTPIYFSDFDELREWVNNMKELLDGYNVLRFAILADTISFHTFNQLAEKENKLLAAAKDNTFLNLTVHEPKTTFNNILNNMHMAHTVWEKTSYRLNIADNYRNKMLPKNEVIVVLLFLAFVFISGVILPLLCDKINKIYYVYFLVFLYFLIFIYIFIIARRIVW